MKIVCSRINIVFFALVLFSTVAVSFGGCASMGEMKSAQSDISSIWERLGLISAENEEQTTKLSRLEKNIIELSLLDETTFAFDSSRLSPPATRRLLKIGKILGEYPGVRITVEGHTDSSGSSSHNQSLSESRARAVADVLIESGVLPENIEVFGFGESRPLASNANPWGRNQNRRVEIAISEAGEKNYKRASLNGNPAARPSSGDNNPVKQNPTVKKAVKKAAK